MPIAGAVISAAGAIGGGLLARSGAKKAAAAQEKAANKATEIQMQMFETTREDLGAYRDVGEDALYTLAGLYGLPTPLNPTGGQAFDEKALEAFRRSPDYEVARREGISAFDKSAASRGLLLSGGQVKELAEFGADLGAKNFGNYANRLMQLVDTGRSAAAQTGQFAAGAARGIADTTLGAGEARASGIVGGNNALASGLSQGFDNLATGLNYYRMSNPSSYVTPTTTYGVGVY